MQFSIPFFKLITDMCTCTFTELEAGVFEFTDGTILDTRHLISIHAGDNGTLTGDRWDFSFGNGNEHSGTGIGEWGYVVPYDWQMVALSIGMRTGNTANTDVEVTVNGVNSGVIISAAGNLLKAHDGTLNLKGVAGDTINFKTVVGQPGGANDVVVTAQLKVHIPYTA